MIKTILIVLTLLLFGCVEKPKNYLCSTSDSNYSPNFQRSLSLRPPNFLSRLKLMFGIEEYELLFGVENYPVTCSRSGNTMTFGKKGEICGDMKSYTQIQFDPIN